MGVGPSKENKGDVEEIDASTKLPLKLKNDTAETRGFSPTGGAVSSERVEFGKNIGDGSICDKEIVSSTPVKKSFQIFHKTENHQASSSGKSNTIATGVRKKFPDGSSFEGECDERGIPHGNGKFTNIQGDTYEGQFVKGKFEGNGKITTTDGNRYIGKFVNSLRHGQGVETLSNGDVYEGLFENDVRSGFGSQK